MAGTPASRASLSHVERTVKEPRDNSLHIVIISRIDQVNSTIRLLRLSIPEGQPPFLPGQWLDVHIPGIHQAGGFSITSKPSSATPGMARFSASGDLRGYLELAVQQSPKNPPTAWLWRPIPEILDSELQVRVGGSFVWPPSFYGVGSIKKVVFVAGGVGINPLMSILSHLAELEDLPFEVRFLYTLRDPGPPRFASTILFLERLARIFKESGVEGSLDTYLTSKKGTGQGEKGVVLCESGDLDFRSRRITSQDLLDALGPVEQRQNTVCYVCSVPTMTDELVEQAQRAEGVDPRQVLFERWW